jgi:hypothetical protein
VKSWKLRGEQRTFDHDDKNSGLRNGSRASCWHGIMKAPKKPPKYTAEQISEITDRVAALRLRWLRFVEIKLASRQKLRRQVDIEKDI